LGLVANRRIRISPPSSLWDEIEIIRNKSFLHFKKGKNISQAEILVFFIFLKMENL
jgi:hypothetical protein